MISLWLESLSCLFTREIHVSCKKIHSIAYADDRDVKFITLNSIVSSVSLQYEKITLILTLAIISSQLLILLYD